MQGKLDSFRMVNRVQGFRASDNKLAKDISETFPYAESCRIALVTMTRPTTANESLHKRSKKPIFLERKI